jgi:hypothetical protein
VQPNTSIPIVSITTQQQQISFSISVQQIEELEGTSVIHSYTLDKVAFTQNVINQGKNQLYNYSGILENAAVINVLVSINMISLPPTFPYLHTYPCKL